MAKYIVIESFIDSKTGKDYNVGDEWKGTATAAKELSTDKNRLKRAFIKEVKEK